MKTNRVSKNVFPRARSRLRFFWQLFIAFALVTILTGGGMYMAARITLARLSDNPLIVTRLWADRLGQYYARQGGWEGAEAMISTYPCGPGWGPWDEDWRMAAVVTAADGTIVYTSDGLGHPLRRSQGPGSMPIVVDGQPIGRVFISPFDHSEMEKYSLIEQALQGLLLTGLFIGAGSLIAGLIISRGMSRPLVRLTEATRRVAAGDLSVRVPAHYPGEVGELASAFTTWPRIWPAPTNCVAT